MDEGRELRIAIQADERIEQKRANKAGRVEPKQETGAK